MVWIYCSPIPAGRSGGILLVQGRGQHPVGEVGGPFADLYCIVYIVDNDADNDKVLRTTLTPIEKGGGRLK
jgi:hypothetical protein